MKKAILMSICVVALVGDVIGQPIEKKLKPWSHTFRLSSIYWHLSDPDWNNLWTRRHLIPEYQIAYKRYALKARFFTLGPYIRARDEDMGILNLPTEIFDGKMRIKEGSVIERSYKMFDLMPEISVIEAGRHTLQVGLGASHRKGFEHVRHYDRTYNVPDVSADFIRPVNEWGAVSEISYSVSFLKYITSSLACGYHMYPTSTGMFTIGIGVGIQLRHKTPFIIAKTTKR
jgi:hypothetical protein